MLNVINSQALEERTQAIGGELLARARQEHAQLSHLNRWTSQVLSWCLSDAQIKSRVLRFIDALPSLQHPRDIAEHLHDEFPTTEVRLPASLRFGASLAGAGLLTHRALTVVVRQLVEQIARQFIAEPQVEGARKVIHALAARGALCSLDVLGERVLSEAEAEAYVAQCRRLLQESLAADEEWRASSTRPVRGLRPNLSLKPSALTPRFDPIHPAQSIEAACRRLLPLLGLAAQHGALLTLDMEQFEYRDLTLALAQRLLVHPDVERLGMGPAGRAALGIVIQAYLRDAEAVLEELLEWLARHECSLTIRLVKGAYWDSEMASAAQRHWPVPVHEEKAATDAAFERLTRRLLGASPLVRTAIASHNVRAIAHAMAVAEALGLTKDQVEFQLLYGMGDAIHAAIVSLGYPVRIYTPIGELIPGMAYLVRRLLENTANESFLRQDFLAHHASAEALLQSPAPTSASAAGASTAARSRQPLGEAAASRARIGEPWLDFSKEAQRRCMAEALERVQAALGRAYPLLVGSREIETGQALTSRNPSDPQQIIGHVAQAGRAEVDEAVRLAAEAQPRWARTDVVERVRCLRRAAELMRQHRHELAAWEILEVGKPWREADADVVEAIEYLEYYSRQMLELSGGRALDQLPGERNRYVYVPRGVAVVIAPWNFPAAILTGMASAALVAGNAVILKPSEQSCVVAARVARLLREAGIPPGVLQFLPGPGEEVGAALVRHPGTHVVLFTGSKTVGLSIIEACARVARGQRFVKHVVTEMGGKNAILVDADADLDEAILGTLASAFGYAGQKCSAASRLIVHEAIADRLLPRLIAATDRLLVGDPADPNTDIGPLIEASAQRRLLEAVDRAQRVGRLAYQSPASRLPPHGFFVSPAIVTDVPREDRLAREELFGPLLCVFRAGSFEEALALANDADYALTGGVYSRSPSHITQALRAFDIGNLYINRPITGALVGRQPFGGHRLSGLGTKAGGPDYLLQMLLPKTICENTARHGTPLE